MQLCGTFLTETLWLLCGAGAIYSCVERDLKTKRLCGAREEEEEEITLWLIVAFGLILAYKLDTFGPKILFLSGVLSSFFNIIFISLHSFGILVFLPFLDPEELVLSIWSLWDFKNKRAEEPLGSVGPHNKYVPQP